jgi:hypothetical protein
VPPKLPELVSGHYLLDFGCVTKGINKSRKVKMTNLSPQQVGWFWLVGWLVGGRPTVCIESKQAR